MIKRISISAKSGLKLTLFNANFKKYQSKEMDSLFSKNIHSEIQGEFNGFCPQAPGCKSIIHNRSPRVFHMGNDWR